MLKKVIAILLALLMIFAAVGCGRAKKDDRFTVVCTIFPIYDWVKNLVGDIAGVEVILLVNNGTDLHSYQPTTKDLVRMLSADLIVHIGGTSDTWVEDSLKSQDKKDRPALLDLSQAEGVTLRALSAESIIEDHDHSHGHENGHDSLSDHDEIDEHLWLSPQNAVACVTAITDALCAVNAENAEQYRIHRDTYTQSLQALDLCYKQAIAKATEPTLLFADRFPFVYLAEEYGIRYVAAHAGCTTEVDATPSTVIHLAEHIDEWGLRYVCVTESSDQTLAKSVIRATKSQSQSIVTLNSMQSVTQKQIEQGASYLGIMKENLERIVYVTNTLP